jgi:hypothetical protein
MQIRLLLADKALEFGNARLGLREPVGLAADGPAPEGDGSSDGKPAGAAPPFHTARGPRRRFSPAIPIRR